MARHWNVTDIPEQGGRTIIVTGANSGIGYHAAHALAGKGASVLLAVRNLEKGESAARQIRLDFPGAATEVVSLDLANLGSIRQFAASFLKRGLVLDVLLNNAGVMALPFRRTVDGFEMQFGTNHLGHFALTGLLLPALLASPAGRVVTVSSLNHHTGRIAFNNLDGSRGYSRWMAYGQSKLANILFAYELQRRLAASGARAISVACHPGYAATNLQTAAARMEGSRLGEGFWSIANLFAQDAAAGALPLLFAAVASEVKGGDYVGPARFFGGRGHPTVVRSSGPSYDEATARRLWLVSEELTGVHFGLE